MSSVVFSRFSIGASLLILAIGIGLGSRQLSEISRLQQQVDSDPSHSSTSTSPRRRTLSSRKESTEETSARLVELEPYGKEDADLDKRFMDAKFVTQITTLSSSQSEEIARQFLLSGNELSKSEIRVVRYCLLSLADENPAVSLDLIKIGLKHPSFPSPHSFHKALNASLVNLGSVDLDPVNEWFNSGPDTQVVEQTKVLRDIFEKRSQRNYDETFTLFNNDVHGQMNKIWAMYGIHESLTLDRAGDYLTAVRNSELSPEQKREALEAFGTQNFAPDFEAAVSWIKDNNFEYQEFRGVLNGLRRKGAGDLDKWISWIVDDSITRNRFSGAYESAMSNLLSAMVREDFVKAGKLINSLPERSRAKEYARSEYAKHMSSVNLDVAIEWFNSLPNGAEKIKTGRDLLQKYHLIAPDKAEEFAIKNNLYIE